MIFAAQKENENIFAEGDKTMNVMQNVFIGRFISLIGENSTQEEIAKKIGTSRQNVGNWLSGKSKPDIFALKNIAQAYGVSTDYLLGISDVKTSDAEKKAVCEYTHLTDTAVDALEYIFEYDPQALTTLIYLLEQHFEVHADKYHFNLYEDQTSILAALSAYLRIEPKIGVTTPNDELYISETGKLLTTQVKAGEKRSFEDGWRVQSVSNREIIDTILFDSLEKAIKMGKQEYNCKITPYKTNFQFNERNISADNSENDDEYPF